MASWTFSSSGGYYTRPLVSSEVAYAFIAHNVQGTSDACFGITFRSFKIAREQLATLLVEGLGVLRYEAPLLAVRQRIISEQQPSKFEWIYEPAISSDEIRSWAQKTLIIHEATPTLKEFTMLKNSQRVSYDGYYFGLHLLCHEEDHVYSLVIHCSHAVVDGRPGMRLLAYLLRYVTSPEESRRIIDDIEWGTEWKNLPVDPVIAAGAPIDSEEWQQKLAEMNQKFNLAFQRSKTSEGFPIRGEPTATGLPTRVYRSIDAETFQRIRRFLRKNDLTVTSLFEGAHALVYFRKWKTNMTEDSYLTYDMSMVDLRRFFTEEHQVSTRMSSNTAFVPITINFTDIPWDASPRDQLMTASKKVREQYLDWLSYPQLAHVILEPKANISPSSIIFSSYGPVEDVLLSTKWPLESEDIELEVIDCDFGNRFVFQRPLQMTWSFKGKFYILFQGGDQWDETEFGEFLDEIVSQMLLFDDDHSQKC